MQDKIRPSEEFSQRTDELAKRLGVSLRSLVVPLDMSKASLFGYRNGAISISAKAWSKLERAERAVGESDNHPAPSRAQETPVPPGYCLPDLASLPGRMVAMEERLERIEALLGRLVNESD